MEIIKVIAWLNIIIVLLFLKLAEGTDFVTRKTKVGDIEGFVDSVSVDGNTKSVTKFLGIPYAEPPTGKNRFQKPKAKRHFTSKYRALKYPPACYQVRSPVFREIKEMSEDCLFLNIYIPMRSSKTSLPVLVWIHGGAFVTGAASVTEAKALSAYGDVVVVTVNYRLEMFGFLRSNDGTLIGNQGLWDQQLAIKWIHENIASFNGDPNEVTIFGESAGSASVLFQALYPGNIGYFKRVIAESGSTLAYWAVNPPNADIVFKQTGCKGASDPILCLQHMSPLDLQSKSVSYKGQRLPYSPCIDNDFLIESPYDIMNGNSSKSQRARSFFASLDILTGVNNFDGALFLLFLWPQVLNETFPDIHVSRDQFQKIAVPTAVHALYRSKCKKALDQIIAAVVFEYTDWSDPNNVTKIRNKLVELSSDASFFSGAIGTVRGHSGYGVGKTYLYEFALNLKQHFLPTPDYIVGSNHGDEMQFVFGYPISDAHNNTVTFTENQKAVSRVMMSLWTNFAKTSDPNKPLPVESYLGEPWPLYTMDGQKYVQFTESQNTNKIKQYFQGSRMAFWLNYVPTLLNIAC